MQPDLQLTVREETANDAAAVDQVVQEAFGQRDEAEIVVRLRNRNELTLSLVAEVTAAGQQNSLMAGHIAFSPVTIAGQSGGQRWLGLAPVSVAPEFQRQGIGSQLIEAGLERCRGLGAELVVVLGEPGYYSRFGFEPASRFGLENCFGVDEPFRVLVLNGRPEDVPHGMVAYSPAVMGTDVDGTVSG
ncbi:MAG: N-acetyltransferase [Planctomycetaceae bacterium]|nr:N-acetyltransferase [Planctomycetaceae bacterium]